eukprot:g1971.t1
MKGAASRGPTFAVGVPLIPRDLYDSRLRDLMYDSVVNQEVPPDEFVVFFSGKEVVSSAGDIGAGGEGERKTAVDLKGLLTAAAREAGAVWDGAGTADRLGLATTSLWDCRTEYNATTADRRVKDVEIEACQGQVAIPSSTISTSTKIILLHAKRVNDKPLERSFSPGVGRNWIAREAKADYVAYLDSDDFAFPDRIKWLRKAAVSASPLLVAARWSFPVVRVVLRKQKESGTVSRLVYDPSCHGPCNGFGPQLRKFVRSVSVHAPNFRPGAGRALSTPAAGNDAVETESDSGSATRSRPRSIELKDGMKPDPQLAQLLSSARVPPLIEGRDCAYFPEEAGHRSSQQEQHMIFLRLGGHIVERHRERGRWYLEWFPFGHITVQRSAALRMPYTEVPKYGAQKGEDQLFISRILMSNEKAEINHRMVFLENWPLTANTCALGVRESSASLPAWHLILTFSPPACLRFAASAHQAKFSDATPGAGLAVFLLAGGFGDERWVLALAAFVILLLTAPALVDDAGDANTSSGGSFASRPEDAATLAVVTLLGIVSLRRKEVHEYCFHRGGPGVRASQTHALFDAVTAFLACGTYHVWLNVSVAGVANDFLRISLLFVLLAGCAAFFHGVATAKMKRGISTSSPTSTVTSCADCILLAQSLAVLGVWMTTAVYGPRSVGIFFFAFQLHASGRDLGIRTFTSLVAILFLLIVGDYACLPGLVSLNLLGLFGVNVPAAALDAVFAEGEVASGLIAVFCTFGAGAANRRGDSTSEARPRQSIADRLRTISKDLERGEPPAAKSGGGRASVKKLDSRTRKSLRNGEVTGGDKDNQPTLLKGDDAIVDEGGSGTHKHQNKDPAAALPDLRHIMSLKSISSSSGAAANAASAAGAFSTSSGSRSTSNGNSKKGKASTLEVKTEAAGGADDDLPGRGRIGVLAFSTDDPDSPVEEARTPTDTQVIVVGERRLNNPDSEQLQLQAQNEHKEMQTSTSPTAGAPSLVVVPGEEENGKPEGARSGLVETAVALSEAEKKPAALAITSGNDSGGSSAGATAATTATTEPASAPASAESPQQQRRRSIEEAWETLQRKRPSAIITDESQLKQQRRKSLRKSNSSGAISPRGEGNSADSSKTVVECGTAAAGSSAEGTASVTRKAVGASPRGGGSGITTHKGDGVGGSAAGSAGAAAKPNGPFGTAGGGHGIFSKKQTVEGTPFQQKRSNNLLNPSEFKRPRAKSFSGGLPGLAPGMALSLNPVDGSLVVAGGGQNGSSGSAAASSSRKSSILQAGGVGQGPVVDVTAPDILAKDEEPDENKPIAPNALHEALLWNQIRKGSVLGAPIDLERFNELQEWSARNSPNVAASIAASIAASPFESRVMSPSRSAHATPPDQEGAPAVNTLTLGQGMASDRNELSDAEAMRLEGRDMEGGVVGTSVALGEGGVGAAAEDGTTTTSSRSGGGRNSLGAGDGTTAGASSAGVNVGNGTTTALAGGASIAPSPRASTSGGLPLMNFEQQPASNSNGAVTGTIASLGGSPEGKKKNALAVQFGEAEVRSRKPSSASIAGVAQPVRPGNVCTSLASSAQSSAAVSMYPSAGNSMHGSRRQSQYTPAKSPNRATLRRTDTAEVSALGAGLLLLDGMKEEGDSSNEDSDEDSSEEDSDEDSDEEEESSDDVVAGGAANNSGAPAAGVKQMSPTTSGADGGGGGGKKEGEEGCLKKTQHDQAASSTSSASAETTPNAAATGTGNSDGGAVEGPPILCVEAASSSSPKAKDPASAAVAVAAGEVVAVQQLPEQEVQGGSSQPTSPTTTTSTKKKKPKKHIAQLQTQKSLDDSLDINQLLSSCPNVSIADIATTNKALGNMSLMELLTHVQENAALPGLNNFPLMMVQTPMMAAGAGGGPSMMNNAGPGGGPASMMVQTPGGSGSVTAGMMGGMLGGGPHGGGGNNGGAVSFLNPAGLDQSALRRPSYDTAMMRGRVMSAGIPFRKCNCKGNVHTCMSPMTSEVQSMINTPLWGRSLHQSQVASISQSRDGSSGESEEEEDEDGGYAYKYTVQYNTGLNFSNPSVVPEEDSSPTSSVEEHRMAVMDQSAGLAHGSIGNINLNQPNSASESSSATSSPNSSKTLQDLLICPEVEPEQQLQPRPVTDTVTKKVLKKQRSKFKRIQKSAMRATSPIPEESESYQTSPQDSRRGSHVLGVTTGGLGGIGGGQHAVLAVAPPGEAIPEEPGDHLPGSSPGSPIMGAASALGALSQMIPTGMGDGRKGQSPTEGQSPVGINSSSMSTAVTKTVSSGGSTTFNIGDNLIESSGPLHNPFQTQHVITSSSTAASASASHASTKKKKKRSNPAGAASGATTGLLLGGATTTTGGASTSASPSGKMMTNYASSSIPFPVVDTAHSSKQVLKSADEEEDEDGIIGRHSMDSPGGPTKNNFEQLTHEELAGLIEKKEPGLLVIDVRGRDFCGGNVPGARNMRTRAIQDDPESLIDDLVKGGVQHVVFTCMYSVLRAITVAGCLSQCMAENPRNRSFKMSILKEGFHGWFNYWIRKEDEENQGSQNMIEKWVANYDVTKWVEQEGTGGGKTFVHVMDAVWSDKGHQLLVNALQEIAADRERW